MATKTTRATSEAMSPEIPDGEDQRRQRPIEANQPLIELLRSWRENVDEDEAREQRETWEFLKQALDEDRLSARTLFPKAEHGGGEW